MQDHELISAEEFCAHYHVEMQFIHSLQEYGLIELITKEGGEFLQPERLNELEKIVHLHYDLDVNVEGIDVILHLLKQLETAQQEAKELKNQLKFYH